MRVLISGTGGFLGRALSERLNDLGHEVLSLKRPSSSQNLGAGAIAWSPLEGVEDPTPMEGLDCVFHLAGRSIGQRRWNSSEKELIRSSRVTATQLLTQQLSELRDPPKVFLSASATGFYGQNCSVPVDESSPAGEDFLARVAAEWENAAGPLVANDGTRCVHCRFGVILGREGGALARMLPIFRLGLGGRLGDGQQIWSWISLEDCVSSLVWLAKQPKAAGAFNIVSPGAVSNEEFTRSLAAALGRPAWFAVPKFLLRLAFGEMADAVLLGNCHAIPAKLMAGDFQFEAPELGPFLEAELAKK